MTFSKTDNSLTVVVVEDGRHQVLATTSNNPAWDQILAALRNQDQAEVVQLMSVKNVVERYTESNVTIEDGNVYFRGRPLHGLDTDRLLEFARTGIPFLPLARFLERKQKNPSYRSINELYKFLEHRHMPLTPNGTVLGYKGVQSNFYSVMGNTATIMIDGQTDSGGHILNTVGQVVRCDRSCVCDDYRQGCSPGLHIGSLEYALGWGARVVIVEFDPADVVSVPDDCECQKLRACAYKVVGEYTGALPDTYSTAYEVNSDPATTDEVCSCGDPTCDGGVDEGEGDLEDQGCCGDPGCMVCNPAVAQDDAEDDAYEDGYALGEKEGKAHKARKHLVTDLDNKMLTNMEKAYIDGYNNGYRNGRYNK